MTRDEILTGLREAMTARYVAEDAIDAFILASFDAETDAAVGGITWDDIAEAMSVGGRQRYDGREVCGWLGWDGEGAVGPDQPDEWFVPKATPA